ncbi:DUF551 domain-containing protein [Cronobacter sakazakii]|uniref:DUF551 domain-containing protein n=1 Tax=Cronobacter sakazakii TaxID=28141 RepID=UPI001EFC788B|nr:DUF551 domain-containing protein [Cronobacter sakazakii]
MSEISEEALAAACAEKVKQLEFSVKQSALDSVRQELETELAIARIALLALRERAEPVGFVGRNKETGKFASWLYPEAPWLTDDKYEVLSAYITPPAPVAAGWIACSERLPEVGDIVLTADNGCVNVGEMDRSGASCRYFTSVVSGRELPATHWMPLPEAPGKN